MAERSIAGANVVSFAPATGGTGWFTMADKMECLRWEARDHAGARLALHTRRADDPPEVGEFASIYPAEDPWAAWGAVRTGRAISVWRARDGRDIGVFATMGEALAAVAQRFGKPH